MKKNTLRKTFAAMAISAVAVSSATATLATTHAEGDFPKAQLSLSEVKVDIKDIANPVKIDYSVSGVAGQWESTGVHIDFDSRLTIKEKTATAIGTKGSAVDDIEIFKAVKDESVAVPSVFITTASSVPGSNGVIYSFDVIVPANAKVGDKYEIKFRYKSGDLFTSTTQGSSTAMTEWAFANAKNGYIEITGVEETTTAPATTTTAPTTTTTAETTTVTTTSVSGTTTSNTATNTATNTTAKTSAVTSSTSGGAINTGVHGVTGVAVAAAGLAATGAAAFVLKKKD